MPSLELEDPSVQLDEFIDRLLKNKISFFIPALFEIYVAETISYIYNPIISDAYFEVLTSPQYESNIDRHAELLGLFRDFAATYSNNSKDKCISSLLFVTEENIGNQNYTVIQITSKNNLTVCARSLSTPSTANKSTKVFSTFEKYSLGVNPALLYFQEFFYVAFQFCSNKDH